MKAELLYQLIRGHFQQDFELLCARLFVSTADLSTGNTGLGILSLQLRDYLFSRHRLTDLFEAVREERPHLDLRPCLHELIAEQFETVDEMAMLFTALGLKLQGFGGQEKGELGSIPWRRFKAAKLQEYMGETDQWPVLLEEIANLRPPLKPALELLPGSGDEQLVIHTASETITVDGHFLQLDFQTQSDAFQACCQPPLSAFLIHGLPHSDNSLRLLLKRLIFLLPGSLETPPRRFSPTSVRPNDASAIWYEVAKVVGLGVDADSFDVPYGDDDKKTIAAAAAETLQKNHIILIFEGFSLVQAEPLVQDLWLPLATNLTNLLKDKQPEGQLLIFVIDDFGELSQPALEKAAHKPLPFPAKWLHVSSFDAEALKQWIDTGRISMKLQFIQDEKLQTFLNRKRQSEVLAQEIFINCQDGIPDKTLRYLCDECGYSWHGHFTPWLQST